MKTITLTQNTLALVDDDDYRNVMQHKWYLTDDGYARSRVKGKRVRMHRFIVGAVDGEVVDHINHNKLDNRRCNLRTCSQATHNQYKRPQSNNKSGYKGVSWERRKKLWRVLVNKNRKTVHRSLHTDKHCAALVYNKHARRHFGEFAHINDVPESCIASAPCRGAQCGL